MCCVKHFLEGKIVQPQEISNSSGFSALDWALYGQENEREGAEEVVAYLQCEWPTMPHKKSDRKRRSGRKRKNAAVQQRAARTSAQQLRRNARIHAWAKGLTRGHKAFRASRQARIAG